MDLKEKASYIMGWLEGLKLDSNEDQNKILKSVVSLLQEMTEKISVLEKEVEENSALVDELDEDLANVEKDLYNNEKDICFKDHSDCHCEKKDDDDIFKNDRILGEEFEKNGKYEVSCTNCGRIIELDEGIFEKEDITCPECGFKVDFDFKNQKYN